MYVLARELAGVINGGELEEREQLREIAVRLLREEVEVGEIPSRVVPERERPFNAFGIGIPLFLAGGILIILFPPVGLVMFVGGLASMIWGTVATLVTRR